MVKPKNQRACIAGAIAGAPVSAGVSAGVNVVCANRRSLGAYGFMALPLAFAGMPLYIYMPDFYVREWGLSLSAAGLILLLLRCIDAGQDLVIGHVCDRMPARRGWIMLAGGVVLSAGMAAVLYGPPMVGLTALSSSWVAGAWFAMSIAMAALGLSVISINLALIGGFWQAQAHGRLRVAAWRESFMLAGMMLAVVLPVILQNYMDAADGFVMVFWVFAVFMLGGGFFFRRFWRVHGSSFAMSAAVDVQSWRFFHGNKAFFAACFLTHLAASLPAALFLFFVRDYLGIAEAAGLFLLLYLGSGILGMPVWQRLAAQYGQARAWTLSMGLAILAFGATLLIAPGGATAFAVICLLSGAALGADLSIPPAMMAARLAARGQTAQGSRAFAVMNMIPKIALGVASGGALLVLGQMGYRAGAPDNTPQVLSLLAVLYAGVPCVLKAVAAWMLRVAEINFQQGESNEFFERSSGDGRYHGS